MSFPLPVEWCGVHVISECSPEYLPSNRIHFLHQMCDFLVDHSVSHPVHVIQKRSNCDRNCAAVDGGKHGAVNKDELVGLHGI